MSTKYFQSVQIIYSYLTSNLTTEFLPQLPVHSRV